MAELPIGAALTVDGINSKYGVGKIIVGKELGRGGQGIVYQVTMDGQPKALKWYHESVFIDKGTGEFDKNKRDKFLDNLRKNVDLGSPAGAFLWPQAIVISQNYNSFGYIMDLRPSEYVGMPKFLLKQRFDSYQARVSAMINIVNGFRILHNKGFSYQDLNDGNFFINPHNGDVLICDNDNVSYAGYSSGILGKNRYMAPEVVLRQKMPDKATDRFSMTLILFMLLCKAHPLEGAAAIPACATPSNEKIMYGSNATFIFDPNDKSNRPVKGLHIMPIKIWPQLPDYLRSTFERAFSKNSMKYDETNGSYAAPRVIEKEWLDILVRFRNSIVRCSCNNEEFVNNGGFVCSSCGKKLPLANCIKFANYSVPAFPGVEIMKVELEPHCTDDEATVLIAEVISAPGTQNNPSAYGIKNVSKETWKCVTSDGKQRNLQPGEIMPVKAGIKAFIGKGQFEII